MKTMKRLERAVFAICAVVLITGFASPRDKHPEERYEDATGRGHRLLSAITVFLDAPLRPGR
jgi:hypothetical protein